MPTYRMVGGIIEFTPAEAHALPIRSEWVQKEKKNPTKTKRSFHIKAKRTMNPIAIYRQETHS